MEVIVQRSEEYLEHHGIMGQKWGVKNGPPYPLDYGDHNASEKSKNPASRLDNYENHNPTRQTQKLEKSYAKVKTTGEAKTQHRKNVKAIKNKYSEKKTLDSYIKQENSIYKKKLSELEISDENKKLIKKILIGVGITAAVSFAAYEVYTHSSASTDAWLMKNLKNGKAGSAQLFTDEKVGNAYNTKNLFNQSQWAALSQEERYAIRQYTGSAFSPMNKLLRGQMSISSPYNSKYAKLIDQCTDGLNKMTLSEDVLVHRGAGSLSSVAKTLKVSETDLKSPSVLKGMVKNGFTYTDEAFFSSGGATTDAWEGVKIHAFAPKGTKGMYVDPVSKIEGEHEFILQRNTSYKLVDYKMGLNGAVTDLFVEVVSQVL